MDAYHGLSPTENPGGLLVMSHDHSTWTTTQRSEERKHGITREPVAMKVARRVRRGGVEKGHHMHLVGVLLYHMAHEKREDGCHSPASVLGWVKGMQPEPELVYRVFAALCETRMLTKAGYARFRNFLLYGERALAGHKTSINIFQDMLTLEYEAHPLSRYSVEWQPDDTHFLRIGNPRLYDHPYQSPQLPLWEPGDVEWFVIIRADSTTRRRRKKGHLLLIQPPLWATDDEASGS